jgi:hypothetical protein
MNHDKKTILNIGKGRTSMGGARVAREGDGGCMNVTLYSCMKMS